MLKTSFCINFLTFIITNFSFSLAFGSLLRYSHSLLAMNKQISYFYSQVLEVLSTHIWPSACHIPKNRPQGWIFTKVTEFCSQVKCKGTGGQESYQGLTQALGALLDWAEELLKSTHSLWWLTGFRQSTCRRRGWAPTSHNTLQAQCLLLKPNTSHSILKASSLKGSAEDLKETSFCDKTIQKSLS